MNVLQAINAVRGNLRNPEGWFHLAEMLEATGQLAEAETCRQLAVAYRQQLGLQNLTLTSPIHSRLQSSDEKLMVLFQDLLTNKDVKHSESLAAALTQQIIHRRLFSQFTTLSWPALEPLIERQAEPMAGQHSPDLEIKTQMVAEIWAALFRQWPQEMSRAYVSLGTSIKPSKHSLLKKFERQVSQSLGRPIWKIVDEQLPHLA